MSDLPLGAADEPIPANVYCQGGEFYDMTTLEQMDQDFHDRWGPMAPQFPTSPPSPTPVLMPPVKDIGEGENTRVLETINSDLSRQRALLEQIKGQMSENQQSYQGAMERRAEVEQELRDIGDERRELLQQQSEAIDRVDLYERMLHTARMAELRRSV